MGDPAIILSDGIVVAFGGIYYDPDGHPYTIAITGPVISCHDADLIDGAIDWNDNGNIEGGEWLLPMNGGLNICKETLSIYDLSLLGESWHDYWATYVGMDTLSVEAMSARTMIQEKTDSPRNLLHEVTLILSAK